jgi:ABC-type branched-subunit amino acid transport system substrate-binding protein
MAVDHRQGRAAGVPVLKHPPQRFTRRESHHDNQETDMTHQASNLGRRDVLRAGVLTAASAAIPMLARAQSDTLRIGVVSPTSGPLGIFGEGDGHVLDLVRKHTAAGIDAGGKRLQLEFIHKDTQSNPVRAAQVAKELINSDKVDLVLSTSTPETVNPVADACEAAGIPALSTTSPWEAFYFGRGAKPGEHLLGLEDAQVDGSAHSRVRLDHVANRTDRAVGDDH